MAFDPNRQRPGGPRDVNEAWFDALIRHQIGLLQVSGATRNKVLRILDATESDIERRIQSYMRNSQAGPTPANLRRLESLKRIIRESRNRAWDRVDKILREDVTQVAIQEPLFLNRAFTTVSIVAARVNAPPTGLLRSIVTDRPFEGKILRDWAKTVRRADIDRIERELAIGMAQGENRTQISRRIVGTVNQNGRNGVTEITRRDAASLIRTAINHASNQAKREFYTYNSDLFSEELYVATLDGKTTPICRSLDGKQFPLGVGPIPPLHYACRSLRVAVIDGASLSNRPAVNTTERDMLRDFTQRQGLNTVRRRADLPRGFKGQYDDFRRTRIRELTGTVPGRTTYEDFLRRQSVDVQNDILGVTKGRLFRRGDLTLDRFVDRQGNELTLHELAQREADAFRKAGLDPAEF